MDFLNIGKEKYLATQVDLINIFWSAKNCMTSLTYVSTLNLLKKRCFTFPKKNIYYVLVTMNITFPQPQFTCTLNWYKLITFSPTSDENEPFSQKRRLILVYLRKVWAIYIQQQTDGSVHVYYFFPNCEPQISGKVIYWYFFGNVIHFAETKTIIHIFGKSISSKTNMHIIHIRKITMTSLISQYILTTNCLYAVCLIFSLKFQKTPPYCKEVWANSIWYII